MRSITGIGISKTVLRTVAKCEIGSDVPKAIAPWIRVTESDWARYGDVTPEEWLVDRAIDDPRDDWDWGDETWDAPELNEHEDQYPVDPEDYDDWGDHW